MNDKSRKEVFDPWEPIGVEADSSLVEQLKKERLDELNAGLLDGRPMRKMSDTRLDEFVILLSEARDKTKAYLGKVNDALAEIRAEKRHRKHGKKA